MGASVGINGLVTSWGGTANTQLIVTGMSPSSFSLDISADELDSTTYAASLVQASYTKGMRTWTGTIESQRKTAAIGNTGSVTFSPGYTTNVVSWDVTFEAEMRDATIFGSTDTTNRWLQFLGGLIRVSGTYEALVDDTTAVAMPAGSSEPATLTLLVASGQSFAVSGFTTRLNVRSAANELNTASYSFRGSGNVTVAASGDVMPFDAGSSIATPVSGELILQATTGRTYTGNALWRRVRMQCPVAGLITHTVDVQGTGALTPA